jgi:hypothetical protein
MFLFLAHGVRICQSFLRIVKVRLCEPESTGLWFLLKRDRVSLHELVEPCIQYAQRERRLLSGPVYDLKHVHRAEVKGDVRLGVLSATDSGQHCFGKVDVRL